jgi:dolichol-phosphate mannosyltransferase
VTEFEGPEFSVVVPIHNEAGAIAALIEEIVRAMAGRRFELVVVDDCSSDDGPRLVERAMAARPEIRLLRHDARAGQSAAIWTGVRAARGEWIATLDGDGQNDPADLGKLIAARDGTDDSGSTLFAGHRRNRRDSGLKRASSRIANTVRSRMLGDATPDTGCGLKLIRREHFTALPAFDHFHRFLPALVIRAGGKVRSIDVGHRPRLKGRSHYGTWDRLWVGLYDLFGVMWLQRRALRVRAREVLRQRGEG